MCITYNILHFLKNCKANLLTIPQGRRLFIEHTQSPWKHAMVCKLVRFYYGEHTPTGFNKVAFDDFEEEEADLHEEKLQQEQIDYLRIDQ